MKPLDALSASEAQGLLGLLFDLDDTLLDHTTLTERAYSSLFALRRSGLRLIALTGRPVTWAEMIVRMWPVDAAIAENGSLAYVLDGRVPLLLDTADSGCRRERRARLSQLVELVKERVPELCPANDVLGRVSDFTFDIGETKRPPEPAIAQAIDLAVAFGARTTRSSVHLHLTFDRMDKGSGAVALLDRLGYDATSARSRFAFIGDSENDAPAFAAFHTTVGVANLRGRFSLTPRFLTRSPKSAGFCEFAARLVALRGTTK